MELMRTLSSAVYFIKSYNTYNVVFTRNTGEQIIHVDRKGEREREKETEREKNREKERDTYTEYM